jgi:hypothetical protein
MDVPENHQLFLQHLRDSEKARWLVALWLVNRGHAVEIQPMREAPTPAEWREYADLGDLHITMRVETKQLSREFTCRADWPFGEDFIVCGKNSFDRAQPKPYAYVILNRAGTHAAFVLASGWRKWRAEKRKDSRYNNVEQDCYLAPIESVVFAPIEAVATSQQGLDNR